MVLHLLHVHSQFAQVLNECVLLVNHCLDLLFRFKVPISRIQLVHLNRHIPLSASKTATVIFLQSI